MKFQINKLGDIVEFLSGGTPSRKVPKYFKGTIPWITGNDVKSFRTRKGREYITEEAIQNSATNLVPRGAILLVTRTGVGKVSIAESDICISQDLTGLIPQNGVNVEYLARYLLSISDRLKRQQRGTTILGVTREFIKNIDVPLPPLPIQKKIAEVLERADAAREKRRQANALTEQFLQSVFLEMFGDPATNPSGWKTGCLGDAIESSEYGTSKKSNEKEIGYPIIGMGNVTYEGRIDLTNIKYVDLSVSEFERLRLKRGDIIFNRTNSSELVGKTTYWNLDINAVIASYLVRIRLNHEYDSAWFSALLNTKYFKKLFFNRSKKAVNQANISPTLLKEFPMYKPPIKEQKLFSAVVDKFVKLTLTQKESEIELDILFHSLMQKAFKGELKFNEKELE